MSQDKVKAEERMIFANYGQILNKTLKDSGTLGRTPDTGGSEPRLTVTGGPPKHVNVLVRNPKAS